MSDRHKSKGPSKGLTRRQVALGAVAGGTLLAAPAPLRYAAAQLPGTTPLKIGVILPKSGPQAFLGQSCQRGADIAQDLLNELGYGIKLDIMSYDSESNVDLARSRAEKAIADGAQVLTGNFDSGGTSAIAQVAEQKGVPFVINIAAAPPITEQGYKFVFRNFPTSVHLVTNGLSLMKDLFAATGKTPKSAVFMHINDTFGQANKGAIDKLFPTLNMPFKILDTIAYDPAAKDLSVEVAKAKASGAEMLMLVSRLNDAMLLVREMVKQRWEPMGIVSPGSPGMYEAQFFETLGKYSEFCVSNVPWYNPKSEVAKKVVAAFKKKFPKDNLAGNIFNVGFTFEAIMIAADAYKRGKSAHGNAMIEQIRSTSIKEHVMIGGPIQFDAKGQNVGIKSAAVQNQKRQPVVVLPVEAAEAKPVFPMPGWNAAGRA